MLIHGQMQRRRENLYIKYFPGQSYNGTQLHKYKKYAMLAHHAVKAVFSSNLMKTVLSQLTIRSHPQIVAYWQERSKEWLGAQQFVTHMGRECTRTMALRLNERDLTCNKLGDTFDKCNAEETSFHNHLLKAGVTRKAWRNKLWLHFTEKSS